MDARKLLRELKEGLDGLQPDQMIEPNNLRRVLDGFEKQTVVDHLAEEEERRTKKELVEGHIRYVSLLFDKSVAYTNLLILGGYATFFALLSTTASDIASGPRKLAALLMTISAATFVVFEVYKSLRTNALLVGRFKNLNVAIRGKTTEEMRQLVAAFDAETEANNLSFLVIWAVTVSVAILTGLGAICIVASAFVVALLT